MCLSSCPNPDAKRVIASAGTMRAGTGRTNERGAPWSARCTTPTSSLCHTGTIVVFASKGRELQSALNTASATRKRPTTAGAQGACSASTLGPSSFTALAPE